LAPFTLRKTSADLPVEAIKWRTTTPAEQPRAFDLLAVVGQLARAGQVAFSGRPSPISS
jgi:hypothetical protein